MWRDYPASSKIRRNTFSCSTRTYARASEVTVDYLAAAHVSASVLNVLKLHSKNQIVRDDAMLCTRNCYLEPETKQHLNRTEEMTIHLALNEGKRFTTPLFAKHKWLKMDPKRPYFSLNDLRLKQARKRSHILPRRTHFLIRPWIVHDDGRKTYFTKRPRGSEAIGPRIERSEMRNNKESAMTNNNTTMHVCALTCNGDTHSRYYWCSQEVHSLRKLVNRGGMRDCLRQQWAISSTHVRNDV